MTIYQKSIWGIITLLGIMLSIWTTMLALHEDNESPNTTSSSADAFMQNVSAVFLDKEGKPSLKINTPEMIHYEKEDATLLTTPEITLYRKSPNPWYITAQYGKATAGIENVTFWQNVVLHHAADDHNPATVIKTATLTFHPHQKTAETTDPIVMEQPNLIVKSVGMLADMKTGNIKLLSHTQGEYVPNS
jgi:lipopolysaccharide export system protein LptC